jgi:hypothetical protein
MSGTVISVPWSGVGPRTTAECTASPSWNRQSRPPRHESYSSTSAPISWRAATYGKRPSKSVSCSTDRPLHCVKSTTRGDCQSVMNPGWVSVCTTAGRSSLASVATHSSVISKRAPMRCSVEMAVTSRSWAQPCTRTRPPVTSPATR